MLLEGHLNISGPGLLERLRKGESVRFIKRRAEFDLKVSDSEKEKIDFGVFIPLNDASEITIETDAKDENPISNGEIYIEIEDPKGGCVALTLNVDQMRALKELFENYLDAHRAHRAMLSNSHVRVKSI